MEIIKVVNNEKKYVSAKDKKEYPSVNFYLVLDNGQWVAIRPSFSKGYTMLDCVAKKVVK